MVKFLKTILRILLYLRWNSLQQLVMVRPTTNGQYLHVAAGTRPSLVAKLKSDENGHVLNVASDALSCFVDVFTFFFKTPITFCFTNILFHFENQNWYHSQFHLPGTNPH